MTSSMPRNRTMVGIVFLTFFVMSLLTNILGPLVPDIISSFKVSLSAAALLPFSFFIAYGVMSIPAGFLVERFGEKPVMIVAFLAGTVGSLSFAFHPTYQVAVVSLFVMGSGMATLQTAINPLLRVSGGRRKFRIQLRVCAVDLWDGFFSEPVFVFLPGSESWFRGETNQSATDDSEQTYATGPSVGIDVLDFCRFHGADDRSAAAGALSEGGTDRG